MQVTLTSIVKSQDMREEFTLDFITCVMADIPLEKVQKMRTFLQKHSKQAGTLSQASNLRRHYAPKLLIAISKFYRLYYRRQNRYIGIATKCFKYTSYSEKYLLLYLISNASIQLEACNHATFSQARYKCRIGF